VSVRIIVGDARQQLTALGEQSVHCIVTSPPYWGQRDYGVAGQIGLEQEVSEYVGAMVSVFAAARRVLRVDGTLWLNLGDRYLAKNLIGLPWRVAFALKDDGWHLRRDIIWHKPNPMPESVTDRPSVAHEYLFLFSRSLSYYYNADAVAEDSSPNSHGASKADPGAKARASGNHSGPLGIPPADGKRNCRSVWTISPEKFSNTHYAVMPNAIAEPCIRAGCPPLGTVLDPFGGAGTTGLVADRLQRNAILIELNPAYVEMARKRLQGDAGMFSEVATA